MTTPATNRQRVALAAGLILIFVWATAFTIQKEVYAAMSTSGFLLARYLLLPLCAAVLLCHRHGLRWPRLSPPQWRLMLAAALLGQVLHVSLVTHGIHQSTAFSSALILACGPVLTLLVLRAAGIERLDFRQFIGVALALGGVVLLLSDKLLRADLAGSLGDLMLLVSAALFSVYSVMAKPLFEQHGSLETVCYTTLLATPFMLLLNFPALAAVPWSGLSPAVWLGFFWSTFVVAFCGWMLWAWVSVVRGLARTAPLMYLMPPLTGVFAWLVAGEAFGPTKILGAALAMGGVAFAQGAANGIRGTTAT